MSAEPTTDANDTPKLVVAAIMCGHTPEEIRQFLAEGFTERLHQFVGSPGAGDLGGYAAVLTDVFGVRS